MAINTSTSSSSSSSFSRLSMSIATASVSKKPRRGSALIAPASPLQPSAIGNKAHVLKSETASKGSGASRCRNPSMSATSILEPTVPHHHIAQPKLDKDQAPQDCQGSSESIPEPRYKYQCLHFAETSSAAHEPQRCAAVLGLDVVLPETVVCRCHSNDHSYWSALATRRSPSQTPRAERYVVASAGGDDDDGVDMGLMARTYIRQGGVILVEHPAVLLPTDAKLDAHIAGVDGLQTEPERHEALFNRMDPWVSKEIYRLKNSSTSSGSESTSEGIFRTNALDVDLDVLGTGDSAQTKAGRYRALFPKTSRCNHSCGPNAIWSFDRRSFTLTLSAVRSIPPGAEITISYINPFLPRHRRRAMLQSRWNFLCHCNHCDVPWNFPGAVAHSDRARAELASFFERVPTWEEWCFGDSSQDLIQMHLRAIDLRAEEGLQGFSSSTTNSNAGCGVAAIKDVAYMKHIDALVMCYGAVGDVHEFRKWVGKARKAKLASAESKERAGHVKVLDMWLREPRKFHVWGWKRHD